MTIPLREEVRAPVARIALAWTVALGGVVWAWILSLAGAMKTVPSMSFGAFVWTLPAPLLALAIGWTVVADARRGAAPRSSLWMVAPVLGIAAFGLLIGCVSYFFQP